jgi:hypothetical protein
MIKSKFQWSQVGPGIIVLGFAFFGAAASILGQEPGAESTPPAGALPEEAASPVEPASAAPSTGDDAASKDSGETQLLDREAIEARLKAAVDAADPDDSASEALVDHYQEALHLYDVAEEQRALLDSYVDALTSAPEATKEARATLEATPQVESSADLGDQPPPGLSSEADVDEINNRSPSIALSTVCDCAIRPVSAANIHV